MLGALLLSCRKEGGLTGVKYSSTFRTKDSSNTMEHRPFGGLVHLNTFFSLRVSRQSSHAFATRTTLACEQGLRSFEASTTLLPFDRDPPMLWRIVYVVCSWKRIHFHQTRTLEPHWNDVARVLKLFQLLAPFSFQCNCNEVSENLTLKIDVQMGFSKF